MSKVERTSPKIVDCGMRLPRQCLIKAGIAEWKKINSKMMGKYGETGKRRPAYVPQGGTTARQARRNGEAEKKNRAIEPHLPATKKHNWCLTTGFLEIRQKTLSKCGANLQNYDLLTRDTRHRHVVYYGIWWKR